MAGKVTIYLLSLCVALALSDPGEQRSIPECGSKNPNGHSVDQTEPENPPIFHDLTTKEINKVNEYLKNHPKIQAVKPSEATLNSSYVFLMELALPKKSEALEHLDKGGRQPDRQARVVVIRGDLKVPEVQECICGPLPDIKKCELVNRTKGQSSVDWAVRPLNGVELKALKEFVFKEVDDKAGFILVESYGAKFTGGDKDEDRLTASVAPVGSGVHKDPSKRLMWLTAKYNLPHSSLHMLNFAVLVNTNSADPSKWEIEKAWYGERTFPSLDDLVEKYKSNSIPKTKITKPTNDDNLFSNLRLKGDPMPPKPQRPPTLVEPDGKRYSVKNKRVQYMGWEFSYRLSQRSGPAVYDVRYKGERIIYELRLAEIATLYSGYAPAVVFHNQYGDEPAVYESSMCLFENTDSHAMRRHLAYSKREGGFFAGMMDMLLTLRATISREGRDVIVDIMFHPNAVAHIRFMTTGYSYSTFLASSEKPYGHRIHENLVGNVRHILFNVKADLDINGQKNRYETLSIVPEKVTATAFPDTPYSQTRVESQLKTTEKESIFDYDFSAPKYHLVHNNDKRNKYNESRAYRIEIRQFSKNLLEPNLGNENTLSWARHHIVATQHKDEEVSSSSIYALFDSYKPIVDFSEFYEDDENIKDQDMVFWLTTSMQTIPHSEDIPNVATTGAESNIFFLPHNYFPECPSISSRDAIFIEYKDPNDPTKGVRVDRNGNSREQCVLPKSTLEEDLEKNPDRILESRRPDPTDF